jgi:hypothetical protein
MAKKFQSKVLPSEFKTMEEFVIKNKFKLTEQVVSSIEFALKNNLSNVEVFSFRNTDFIVVLNVSTFKENLENIYNYYINTEQYEFCERVSKLQKIINQQKPNEQEKRHKSKSPSKSKNKGFNSN